MDNNYEPTAPEKKILLVMADIEYYNKSVTEICKAAGVSRNTYYQAMKKSGFLAERKKVLDEVFNALAPEIKRAAVGFAVKNAKNFQDRKMILEMTGEYRQTQDINLKKQDKISEDVLENEFDEFENN